MIELNKIHNEDCFGESGMNLIPNESIDMIFCDLPYGTTQCKWDSVLDLNLLWNHYKRVIKENGAIVLFAQTPFDKVLGASNLQMLKYEWIWEKNKATGHLNSKRMPMKSHENILVFYKKLPTYNPQMTEGHKPMNYAKNHHNSSVYSTGKSTVNQGGSTSRYPRDVLRFPVINNDDPGKFHQTQKPIELCEYMIKTYTNEGEIVLDNCSGSGVVAEACINLDRNFICFEKDSGYWGKSVERIHRVTV